MGTEPAADVTGLLQAWTKGDRAALDDLIPILYDELRRIARRTAARERSPHTLQPTAIVNEAYLRLVQLRGMQWQDRSHFFAVSAELMRRILVDRARRSLATKRGARATIVPLADDVAIAPERPRELVQLDDALKALASVDARKARVVELRIFGGLNAKETAVLLGLSIQTIHRDWQLAKAWLTRAMRTTSPRR
jgi:RNA polymerase sigma factor (TIGR02999 family)